MNDLYADLHAHSRASDGWSNPADVVALQAAHGVGLVSLTDHDTFAATAVAANKAAQLGIAYVAGVEITAAPPRRMNHLLAHGVRTDDPGLGALLDRNRTIWRREALAVRDHLRDRGFRVPDDQRYDDTDAMVMPHTLARDLIRTGVARHAEIWAEIDTALARLPTAAYAAMPEPPEIAEAVHGAGGLLVWAHPGQCMDAERMRSAARYFDALEVFTPRHSRAVAAELQQFCADIGKPYTTGWDFHGYPRYRLPPVPLDPAYVELLADRITW